MSTPESRTEADNVGATGGATMPWIRLCASNEIAEGSATVLTAGGVKMLVIKRGGRFLAVPPPCSHMTSALAEGAFAECLEGDTPKCNRHLAGGRAESEECPGTTRFPISRYETTEIAGVLYANPARQRLSDLQYLTCSPIAGPGSASLRINLWCSENGEGVESVRGDPRPAAATRKR